MKICLSCSHASPRGSVYCQGCSRTFGKKLCANKHSNAPSPQVQFCAVCGSSEMTEPTRFLNLSWAAPLLAGLIALGFWRWGLAHWLLLGTLLAHLALVLAALLLDTTPCGVLAGMRRILVWIIALWVLGWMMTVLPSRGGPLGNWLRALPASLGKLAGRGGHVLIRLAMHGLRRAVWPPSRKSGPSAKEKPE